MSEELTVTAAAPLEAWDGAADRAIAMREERNKIVDSALIKGEDYGTIPGCGKKPVLFKSGAESIANSLNLWPSYEVLHERQIEDWDTPRFNYSYRCSLRQRGTETIVATGIASCNSMEKKYKNSDVYSLINTIDKMAQKRSFVAACLSLGLSHIFTQDLEDDPSVYRDKPPVQQPQRQAASDEVLMWEGAIDHLTVKKGQTQEGKEWEKFTVHSVDDGEFSTFSRTLADQCKALSGTGEVVVAEYVEDQYGRKILTVAAQG